MADAVWTRALRDVERRWLDPMSNSMTVVGYSSPALQALIDLRRRDVTAVMPDTVSVESPPALYALLQKDTIRGFAALGAFLAEEKRDVAKLAREAPVVAGLVKKFMPGQLLAANAPPLVSMWKPRPPDTAAVYSVLKHCWLQECAEPGRINESFKVLCESAALEMLIQGWMKDTANDLAGMFLFLLSDVDYSTPLDRYLLYALACRFDHRLCPTRPGAARATTPLLKTLPTEPVQLRDLAYVLFADMFFLRPLAHYFRGTAGLYIVALRETAQAKPALTADERGALLKRNNDMPSAAFLEHCLRAYQDIEDAPEDDLVRVDLQCMLDNVRTQPPAGSAPLMFTLSSPGVLQLSLSDRSGSQLSLGLDPFGSSFSQQFDKQ